MVVCGVDDNLDKPVTELSQNRILFRGGSHEARIGILQGAAHEKDDRCGSAAGWLFAAA